MRYWYMFYIEECVLCGHTNKWKERQLTVKPSDPSDRYQFKQFACCHHF